ncbi:hypothetical protein [Pseudactinotalea terrae]|uniref:hypothetical protein n=1 Tax=Pseudactinotalea terrae TaxID=1743262 RepID=UPI0012E16D96|nr:hypothetical protein [Pseudactinotalea terrae]
MSTLEEPKGEEPKKAPEEQTGPGPGTAPTPPPMPSAPPEGEAGGSTWSEVIGAPSTPGPAESEGQEPAEGAGSTLAEGESSDPLDADEISVDPTRVRRAPRFGRFVLVGVLLGLLIAVVQTRLASPEAIADAGGPWASNTWGFFWLMSAIFVPIAVLLMCGIALLIERRSRRGK